MQSFGQVWLLHHSIWELSTNHFSTSKDDLYQIFIVSYPIAV